MDESNRLRAMGLIVVASGLALLGGCNSANDDWSSDGRPRMLTTVTMVSDLVRRVGEDTVQVRELMGPGIDPHIYEVKASDRRKLDTADRILFSGLHLEGTMASLLEENSKARAVTHDIPRERLLVESGQADPHVWFDVSLWIFALNAVEKELSALLPKNADRYRQNAAAYRKELEALHEEVKRDIATVPKDQRVMVTAHDAFRYFGRAYDIEVMGLQGVSTEDEAGLNEIRKLADLMTRQKIKAIFPETSVPSDGINKVIQQCAGRGHTVQLAKEKVFSDAMGPEGTPGGTYPGMVRHNVRVIVEALK